MMLLFKFVIKKYSNRCNTLPCCITQPKHLYACTYQQNKCHSRRHQQIIHSTYGVCFFEHFQTLTAVLIYVVQHIEHHTYRETPEPEYCDVTCQLCFRFKCLYEYRCKLRGRKSMITPEDEWHIKELIDKNSDITINEIKETLNLQG